MMQTPEALIRRLPAIVLLLAVWCLPWSAGHADTIGSEYAVKAAIVYKIAKFVTWPDDAFESAAEPLSICLPADDPIREAMDGLAGDEIHGRRIEIRTVETESIRAAGCEVLFISSTDTIPTLELLEKISNQPVLTVGERDDFSDLGGIVTLRVRKNRVSFGIDVDASETAGLGISAQLLQIAGINADRKAKR